MYGYPKNFGGGEVVDRLTMIMFEFTRSIITTTRP